MSPCLTLVVFAFSLLNLLPFLPFTLWSSFTFLASASAASFKGSTEDLVKSDFLLLREGLLHLLVIARLISWALKFSEINTKSSSEVCIPCTLRPRYFQDYRSKNGSLLYVKNSTCVLSVRHFY